MEANIELQTCKVLEVLNVLNYGLENKIAALVNDKLISQLNEVKDLLSLYIIRAEDEFGEEEPFIVKANKFYEEVLDKMDKGWEFICELEEAQEKELMLKAHNEKMNEFKELVTNFIDGLKEDIEILKKNKYKCQIYSDIDEEICKRRTFLEEFNNSLNEQYKILLKCRLEGDFFDELKCLVRKAQSLLDKWDILATVYHEKRSSKDNDELSVDNFDSRENVPYEQYIPDLIWVSNNQTFELEDYENDLLVKDEVITDAVIRHKNENTYVDECVLSTENVIVNGDSFEIGNVNIKLNDIELSCKNVCDVDDFESPSKNQGGTNNLINYDTLNDKARQNSPVEHIITFENESVIEEKLASNDNDPSESEILKEIVESVASKDKN